MDSAIDPIAPSKDAGAPATSILDATRSSPETQLRGLALDEPPLHEAGEAPPPVSTDDRSQVLNSERAVTESFGPVSSSTEAQRDESATAQDLPTVTSTTTPSTGPPHPPLYKMFSTGRSTVVSAPGKVLMAGGYLVLERKYMGLVVATSSRFYTCVVDMPLEEGMVDVNTSRKSSRTPSALSMSIPVASTEESTQRADRGAEAEAGKTSNRLLSAQHDPRAAMITVRAGQFPSSSATWIYRLELDEGYLPPQTEETSARPKAAPNATTAQPGNTPAPAAAEPSATSSSAPHATPSAVSSGNDSKSDKRSSKSSLEALLEVDKAAEIPLPPSPSDTAEDADPAPPSAPPPQIPSMTIVPPSPFQPTAPPPPRPRPALHITQINDHSVGSNKFIEIALSRTLELAWEMLCENDHSTGGQIRGGEELLHRLRGTGDGIIVVVLADNDFYSQRPQLVKHRLPLRLDSLNKLQPFISLPQPIHKTSKTGLGSSAALTTSFVAAILSHLRIVDLPVPREPGDDAPRSPLVTNSLDLVHSLAQLSHCLAQGKVGSGFDVSSAVYGSHHYRRFSPSLLTPLMSVPVTPITLSNLLLHLDPQRWNQQTARIRLPRGIRLMLADVEAGTDTPSFVSKVLKWKEREPEEAHQIWWRLNRANGMLEECIADICALEKLDYYDETLEGVSRYPIRQIDRDDTIGKQLFKLYNILKVLRGYLRVLTAASDVPVEPMEQTALLNECQKVPGVIGGGVPGAGGFDAIYLLVIDQPAVVSAVEDVWENYKELSVCPLSSRQSDGGLELERMEDVRGLQQRLEEIVDGA